MRVLTINLWGEQPPLERRMALLIEGIATLAPDVVALQEVQDRPPGLPNQAEALAAALGMKSVFAPAVAFRGGHEGLALLSKLPIMGSEARPLPHATADEARVVLSASFDAGGPSPVWVHTTHLNYRLQHGQQREDQVMAVEAAVAARPDAVPQIVMGDFNARPESDEIRWLTGLHSLGGRRVCLQDAWARVHPGAPGWTWAASNPQTRSLAFLQLDRRLDYIFVTPERRDGRGRITDCRVVFDTPGEDGVFVSDHYGLLADVQIIADQREGVP